MSNIRSLAGYVTTRDGEHLAFAILLNNFEGGERWRFRRSTRLPSSRVVLTNGAELLQ